METWLEIGCFLYAVVKISQICVINTFHGNIPVIKTSSN